MLGIPRILETPTDSQRRNKYGWNRNESSSKKDARDPFWNTTRRCRCPEMLGIPGMPKEYGWGRRVDHFQTHTKKWRFFCGKARRWGRTWKERDAADAGDSQKDAGGISGERLFVCGHRPRSGAPFTERRRSAKPEVQLGNIRNEFHMNFDFFDTKKKPGKRKTR